MAEASREQLILRADALARGMPTAWDQFVQAFRAYSDSRTKACVMASPTDTPIAQGMARQCAVLLELLENPVKVADQIRNGRTTK